MKFHGDDQFEPTAEESAALSLVLLALTTDQQKRMDYPTGLHGLAMIENAVRKLRGQIDADLSLPPGVAGCRECAQQYAALVAAAALRFIVDLTLDGTRTRTGPAPIKAGGLDLSPADLERIRQSFKQSGRAVVERPDGTKAHFLGAETGAFNLTATEVLQRGPMHHDEDEVGFGQPYDSHGG